MVLSKKKIWKQAKQNKTVAKQM